MYKSYYPVLKPKPKQEQTNKQNKTKGKWISKHHNRR